MQEQKFMSLKKRVEYLWHVHHIHISISGLRYLYLKHGINHRQARSMKKHLILDKERYFRLRADCAWKLLSLVMNNEPLVYVDETTVTMNNKMTKTW